MMNADDLALEKRPHAFNPVDMNGSMPYVLASPVAHCVVPIAIFAETRIRGMLIRHDRRALFDVGLDHALHAIRLKVRHHARAKLAVTFDDAEHDFLASAAL